MAAIDITRYIHCPADILDLQGRAYLDEGGVPCRIKVGPRRVLMTKIHPEEVKLTIWEGHDGQITYRPDEPVEISETEDGNLYIDAVALVRKYYKKEEISFCSPDYWRWNKKLPLSDSFLTTPQGVAASRSTWLDINRTHSSLYLKPGALTLCGHDVLNLFWSAFDDEAGAHSRTMRPLVQRLLNEPHDLTAEGFRQILAEVPKLSEFGIDRLRIRTDRGDYVLDKSLNEYIAASLKGCALPVDGYRINRTCSFADQVDILLGMLQANSATEIDSLLKELHKQKKVLKLRK